jgi:hypothetical protein
MDKKACYGVLFCPYTHSRSYRGRPTGLTSTSSLTRTSLGGSRREGCGGQFLRPVKASVTPSPIMARPPTPPTSPRRWGDRVNQDRTVLAAIP